MQRAYDAAQRGAITTGPEQSILYATYLREQGRLGGLGADREAAVAVRASELRPLTSRALSVSCG